MLGDGVSSYTFLAGSDSGQTFEVRATQGSTIYDCLSYSVTATVDPSSPNSSYQLPTQAIQSNKVSDIGMTFEAETDANGEPIMVTDNPFSPAPTDGSSSSSSGDSSDDTDPLPPPANLVKVDLVYPSSGPLVSPITLIAGPTLRFWSSDTEGSPIVGGGPTDRIDFGSTAPPTTLYAELIGNAGAYNDFSAAFSYNGAVSQVMPVAVSLSFAGAEPGDPGCNGASGPGVVLWRFGRRSLVRDSGLELSRNACDRYDRHIVE